MTDHHTEQLALYLNARDSREYGTAAWGDLDLAGQEAYLTDATAIVAAMKALGWAPTSTPTDDEREALIGALLDELGWEWDEVPEEHIPSSRSILADMADRVLAVTAGFRRSEVPSVGWSAEDRREALGEALRRWSVQAQRDRVDQRDQDLYGMGARQGFALGAEWWKVSHPSPEPQGEQSDAQVDAVAVAIAVAANADYWTDEIAEWEGAESWYREAYPNEHPHMAYEDREQFRTQARAALRAAGGVR